MASKIRVELVTPSARLVDREVDEVRVPGAAGGFGVRPGHAHLLSSLGAGALALVEGGEEERYLVCGGFVEVGPASVVVLAAEAIPAGEVNTEAARAEIDEALEALRGQPYDSPEYREAAARLERARAMAAL